MLVGRKTTYHKGTNQAVLGGGQGTSTGGLGAAPMVTVVRWEIKKKQVLLALGCK